MYVALSPDLTLIFMYCTYNSYNYVMYVQLFSRQREYTALLHAAKNNNVKIVEILLNWGADTEAKCSYMVSIKHRIHTQ